MKKILLLLVATFLFANNINNNHKKHLSVINEFYFKIMNKNIYNNDFNKECIIYNDLDVDKNNSILLLKKELMQEDIDLLKKQNNFKLNAGSRYSYGNTKDNNINTSVGLSYDFFKNGRSDNIKDLIIAENKLKLDNIFNNKNKSSDFSSLQLNKIISNFSKLKLNFNEEMLRYLNELLEIKKEQRILHKVKYEEIIDIRQMITRIESLDFEYQLFLDKENRNDFNCIGGVFDINIKKLILDMNNTNNITDIKKAYYENIDQKYKFQNEMKLKIYANVIMADETSGWNTGVLFQMPLYSVKGNKDKIEKKIIDLKLDQDINKNKNYVKRLYYEYRYKLDDLIKLYYKYEKERFKLKRAKLAYDSGLVNRIDYIINKIKDILLINQQLLEVKQQLYTKATIIFGASGLVYDNQYITMVEKNIRNDVINEKKETRSLYIWANGFKKYDNNLLSELLKEKNYNDLIISVSKNQDMKKFEKFLGIANKKDVKVQMLLSSNKWSKEPNEFLIKKTIHKLKKYPLDYHLDIEMHTYKDWKKRKKFYYNNYINILKYINEEKDINSKINIDIPLHYDIEELIKMKKYVNKFYVMAYEIKKASTMIRRLSKYKKIKKDLIIILNAKEFNSILELELFIKELKENDKDLKIGIHNLKTLLIIGL